MNEMDQNNDLQADGPSDEMLLKLFHLKGYERPDPARMVRSRQNIMRQIRETKARKWTLSDLLEVNIPWFFAEPRYGIAALFVVFAALQFWGVNAQKQMQADTDMYVPSQEVAVAEASANIYTNSITYPKLPKDLQLSPHQQGNNSIKPVGRKIEL